MSTPQPTTHRDLMAGEFLRSHREHGTIILERSGAQFLPGKSAHPEWADDLVGYDGRYPLRHGLLAPIAYDELVSVESRKMGVSCQFKNSADGSFKAFVQIDEQGLVHTACQCGGSPFDGPSCCGHQIVAIQTMFVYADMPGVGIPAAQFEQMKEQHKQTLARLQDAGEAPLMAAQSGYLIMKHSFDAKDERYVIDSDLALASWDQAPEPQFSQTAPNAAAIPEFDWDEFSL